MKKPFYLMLLLATMLTFTACSNDKNALSGTTWTSLFVDELFVIEFEDNGKVSGFIADVNGNIKGKVYYGTYAFTNNSITLNDFYIVNSFRFYFTNGTVSGNNMTLNYYFKYDNGNRYDSQRTFRKQ